MKLMTIAFVCRDGYGEKNFDFDFLCKTYMTTSLLLPMSVSCRENLFLFRTSGSIVSRRQFTDKQVEDIPKIFKKQGMPTAMFLKPSGKTGYKLKCFLI